MRLLITIGALVCALFIWNGDGLAESPSVDLEKALLVFDNNYHEALTQILVQGGLAIHQFPEKALIVLATPEVLDKLAKIPGVKLYDQATDITVDFEDEPVLASAVNIWNVLFCDQDSKLTDPPEYPLPPPTGFPGSDSFYPPEIDSSTAGFKQPDIPFGASATETSEYFVGSVTVAIFTMESNGSGENWTPAEILNVQTEIAQGLNNWITFEPNASLSFTYVNHNQQATIYEPIQGPSTNDQLWMQEAMNALGYSNPSVWVNLRNYDNDLRINNNTDWAFSVFVIDDTNDTDKMFTDLASAYAYIGGPAMVMTYDNGTSGGIWGITLMDMVMSHETAHIFYALDEYHPICTNFWPCTSTSGYLWVQNQNCDLNGIGGCALNQTCVMRNNNVANRCQYTRGQLGLTDTDLDNIPDVRDTIPDSTLTPQSPNPTALTTLVYNGSATVTPMPRVGGTGNNISVNTLAAVMYRVNGGGWASTIPLDGTFDGPQEPFTFTFGPLPIGTHTFETMAINNVGNAETSFPIDTVQIVQGPTAAFAEDVTSGVAPLTVNFTDATTGYVTAWSWAFGDGGVSSIQNPSHQYTAVGNFTVSLTASGGGAQNTLTKPNLINVTCPDAAASFTAAPMSGPAPLQVNFNDTSTTYAGCGVTAWAWDFGDGNNSTVQNPANIYTSPGTYTVSLTVTNPAGQDTSTQTDLIVVSGSDDDDDNDDDNNDDDNDNDNDNDNNDDNDDTSTSSDDDDDDDGCGC